MKKAKANKIIIVLCIVLIVSVFGLASLIAFQLWGKPQIIGNPDSSELMPAGYEHWLKEPETPPADITEAPAIDFVN